MHEIPPSLAARAMGVSPSSISLWLASGDLTGEQTITGRWWITVASCRALIRRRAGENSAAEATFDHVLMQGELPKSPFAANRVQRSREAVVCS